MKTHKTIRAMFAICGLIFNAMIANAQLITDVPNSRIYSTGNLLLQSANPGVIYINQGDQLSGNTIINYKSSGRVGIGLLNPSLGVRVDIDPTSRIANPTDATLIYRSALRLRAGIRRPSHDPDHMAQILFSAASTDQFTHSMKSFHSRSVTPENAAHQNALVFTLWHRGQTLTTELGNLEVMRLSDRNGGSVGIGTPAPNAKLHVAAGSLLVDGTTGTIPPGNGPRMMYLPQNAAIRSGTVVLVDWDDLPVGNNSAAFGVNAIASGANSFSVGAATSAGGTNSCAIGNFAGANGNASTAIGTNVVATANNSVVIGTGQTALLAPSLTNNVEHSLMVGFRSSRPTLFVGPSNGGTTTGNVGIGTSDPQFKLDVAGTIRACEMRVDLNGGWCDYVFKDDYPLLPIKELKRYIAINKHLPDVPSEKQVLQDGINVGDMNAVLLKKIEELTLYIIDQDRRIGLLEKSQRP